MAPELAKYACDECRNRKIRCTREADQCSQCNTENRHCVYSRTGVIRRRPRQRRQPKDASSIAAETQASPPGEFQTQMEYDIHQTEDSLRQFGEPEDTPTGTLASLEVEYNSFWQGPSLKDMARELGMDEKKLISFDETQVEAFARTYETIQSKGRPMMADSPPDLVRAALIQPASVHEKAHLVKVYGILLTDACLDPSFDKLTITKLRWNLRLALDDAKLLLEPTDLNIQALMLLALHVQEVTTPSLCWMILSTACRMLQVLGINSKSLDQQTRDRRIFLFWTLNAIDKELGLVFGRPPTIHGSMSSRVPEIPMHKLLEFQPTATSTTEQGQLPFRSMYGAHYIHQMHRSSIVLSEIWSCVFEDGSKLDAVRAKLDEWYQPSLSTLEACITSEQPFLSPPALYSMRLGIKNLQFNYHYLKVLLLRSRPTLKPECIAASQEALFLLEHLVSDSSEVYNGVVWVLLYCPFTPFFILFGEILSSPQSPSSQKSLEAMRTMMEFLAKMRPLHPRAAKLYTIASTFVQYAEAARTKPRTPLAGNGSSRNGPAQRLAPSRSSLTAQSILPSASASAAESQAPQPLLDLLNDPSMQNLSMDLDFWQPNHQTFDPYSSDAGLGFGPFGGVTNENAYGFFADSTFDWLSWDLNPEEFGGG